MAASSEEGVEMRRRKRFTIRLVALGLAVAALSAPPAQAKLDEGLNGLQPSYTEQTLVTADDIGRPTPVSTSTSIPQLVTADDVKHPSLTSEPTVVVQSGDGFEIGTLGISGIVLLLGVGAAFMAAYQVRKVRHASA